MLGYATIMDISYRRKMDGLVSIGMVGITIYVPDRAVVTEKGVLAYSSLSECDINMICGRGLWPGAERSWFIGCGRGRLSEITCDLFVLFCKNKEFFILLNSPLTLM